VAASGFAGRTASYNRVLPTLGKDACGLRRVGNTRNVIRQAMICDKVAGIASGVKR